MAIFRTQDGSRSKHHGLFHPIIGISHHNTLIKSYLYIYICKTRKTINLVRLRFNSGETRICLFLYIYQIMKYAAESETLYRKISLIGDTFDCPNTFQGKLTSTPLRSVTGHRNEKQLKPGK